MSSIHSASTGPASFDLPLGEASPLSACVRLARRPDLLRVRQALMAGASPDAAALHVLYNLLRGVPAMRGFQPYRPQRPGRANLWQGFERAALRAKALAQSLELTWEDTFSHTLEHALRQAYLADFAELCRVGQAGFFAGPLMHAMRHTPHGAHSTVAEHGWDCWNRYYKLVGALRAGRIDPSWPQWLKDHGVALLGRQRDATIMQPYLVHHDCGKAATMQRDSKGRLHFPGHAQASGELCRKIPRVNPDIAALMELDMVLHTAKPEELAQFAQNPLAPSLLLATYAELLSNADSVFGGPDSKSFRSKLAALNERAEALLRCWGLD